MGALLTDQLTAGLTKVSLGLLVSLAEEDILVCILVGVERVRRGITQVWTWQLGREHEGRRLTPVSMMMAVTLMIVMLTAKSIVMMVSVVGVVIEILIKIVVVQVRIVLIDVELVGFVRDWPGPNGAHNTARTSRQVAKPTR